MSKPLISNNFCVSNFDGAIDPLEHGQGGDCTKVRVKLYCDQSVREDDDDQYASYEAVFFGRSAQAFIDNFSEGDPVQVTGKLRIEERESNGTKYFNTKIWNAVWDFIPSPVQDFGNNTQSSNGRSSNGREGSSQSDDRRAGRRTATSRNGASSRSRRSRRGRPPQ